MERSISVVVKPTLACNMDCGHCYHTVQERSDPLAVSFEDLDRLFRLVSEEYESSWFIWHGGEPLTLPLSFYKKAIELQEKHFGTHRTGNTIQTNGLGVDRSFIKFCKDKSINIGISHEGPCDGILRQNCERVESTIRRMSEKERVFSVSSTISRPAQSRQREIYEHFRDLGSSVSLSPVIPAGCAASRPDLVPDPDAYAEASIDAFDDWVNDRDADVPLLPHYLYLLNALGTPEPADCAHTSCLTRWICMHPNGDLYPCGKACPGELRMCNINDVTKLSDAFRTEGFARILRATIARREKCASCPIFGYCQGECSVDALYEGGMEDNGFDSCRIYRRVFAHVKETADRILGEDDLSVYNRFVRDAVVGRLTNPALARRGRALAPTADTIISAPLGMAETSTQERAG